MKDITGATIRSSHLTGESLVKKRPGDLRFDRVLDAVAHALEKEGPGGRRDAIRTLSGIIERQMYDHCVRSMAGDTGPWHCQTMATGGLQFLCALSATEDRHPSEPPGDDVVAPDWTNRIIDYSSRRHGVDATLIRAVIRAESNFDNTATSTKGAMGLMQIMPETARELGVKNPYDPVENIMGGTRYLKMLLDRYDGNRNTALAAYNWGMGNVERYPHRLPEETKTYIVNVNRYIDAAKRSVQSV